MEEGLDRVENIRFISCIEILLSLDIEDVNVTDIGYQPPVHHGQDQDDLNSIRELKGPDCVSKNHNENDHK